MHPYLIISFLILSTPWTLYRKTREIYKEGSFEKAKVKFEELLAGYPNHTVTPYCLYYIGNLEKDSKEAIKRYKLIVDSFPDSKVADNALFRLACYHYARGEYEIAGRRCEEIMARYPEGDCARMAKRWVPTINTILTFSPNYAIQVGAFKLKKNAKKLKKEYEKKKIPVRIIKRNEFYVVLVGEFKTKEETERFRERHNIKGFIVKYNLTIY
jgi:tetratricopeptide (TPR) repeat protein